jgi:hypothetical protein
MFPPCRKFLILFKPFKPLEDVEAKGLLHHRSVEPDESSGGSDRGGPV